MLLMLLEISQRIAVHQGDFVMFRPLVQELLNIKQFCHKKFSKIKTTIVKRIGSCFWYYWNALDERDFMEVNFCKI
jgi:hypothetical protein